jgi:hypothetical protein
LKNIKDFEDINALEDVCPRCGQVSDECICASEDYYSTKNIYKLPTGKHYDFKKKKEEKPLPKPYGIEESLLESSTADEELWKRWNSLINMTEGELKKFYESEEGKEAGMKKSDAKSIGINTGRESAKMLLKMIPSGKTFKAAEENWTPSMWKWCGKQVSFNSRMKGMKSRIKGNPYEKDGKMTRWLSSLLIWGHDPRK